MRAVIGILLLSTASVFAQPAPVSTNDPAAALQNWAAQNLDGNIFDFLGDIDQDQVIDFFNQIQHRFDSTNIYDLATIKAVARQILPVLQEYEETEPYAVWLKAHLDDLDAAGEMQREMKAARRTTGKITVVPMPSQQFQRSFWSRRLQSRPLPPLAGKYVPELKEIFASEKIPPQLVWLASVESSFDPRARSPEGAAGMFQLMPATARLEKLSLWPFDERYQPEKSAHAAARYLRLLHAHYGNWPLALAAYNAGEGRVDKLLKQHKEDSFGGIARWLPAETQMYVPKIEATIRQREGIPLDAL
jgi:membrane-bound lytic murein transglycosylase D